MPARTVDLALGDFATLVRRACLAMGWTQRELSRRSGVSQSLISRLDRGRLTDLRLSDLDAICMALGVRYRFGFQLPELAVMQADSVHARCSGHVARRLHADRWLVGREIEIGRPGEAHGWIDVLAFDPATRTVLVIEVKTEIRDLGAIERSVSWYERQAMAAARSLGWRPARVVSALLVLHTAANQAAVRSNRDALDVTFPGRAVELRSVVRHGPVERGRRFIALIDPRSKRREWLVPTPLEAGRWPAPYVDYIDAVRQLDVPARPRDAR